VALKHQKSKIKLFTTEDHYCNMYLGNNIASTSISKLATKKLIKNVKNSNR
jgi:uncharacterized protein YlbG (UPF0298 family)